MEKTMINKILSVTIAFFLSSTIVNASPNYVVKDDAHLKWQNMPNSAGKFAVLAGNPKKNEFFVVRVKFPTHYTIRPHHHVNYEYDTVIKGKNYLAFGEHVDKTKGRAITAGQFVIIPPNVAHYGWTTDSEAIMQITGIGPWRLVYEKQS
jgi:quercetin dioxygenase-like cupin family protein